MITEVKEFNNIKIIYLNDEIYSNKNSNEFDTLSEEYIKKGSSQSEKIYMILNFKNTSFINSTVLGEILKLYKNIKKFGGELVLCDLCSDIANLFEITKINTLIKVFQNEEAATHYFSTL